MIDIDPGQRVLSISIIRAVLRPLLFINLLKDTKKRKYAMKVCWTRFPIKTETPLNGGFGENQYAIGLDPEEKIMADMSQMISLWLVRSICSRWNQAKIQKITREVKSKV